MAANPNWRPWNDATFSERLFREQREAEMQQDGADDELLAALRDAADNGLIYWEPQTDRGHVAKAQMLARIRSLLAKHGGAA